MRLSTTIAVIILTCAFIYALFAVYVLQHITDGQKCPTWAAKAPCSNHGSCATSGNCQCEPGYGGMDCSIAHSAVVGLLVDRHFDQPDAPQIHKAFAELPQMGFLSPWHEHVTVVRQDEYADSEGGRRISGIKNTVGIRDILPNHWGTTVAYEIQQISRSLAVQKKLTRIGIFGMQTFMPNGVHKSTVVFEPVAACATSSSDSNLQCSGNGECTRHRDSVIPRCMCKPGHTGADCSERG